MSSDPRPEPPAPARGPLRWLAAALCIVYGFAKINDAQFTSLDSQLTKPMGEVSGFWLTWYYFGYSPVYKAAIALAEIVGGLLLVWPRTALVGALLLLPVVANIVLIDLLYGVDLGAAFVAMIIGACLLGVIGPHVPRLRRALILEAVDRRPRLRLAAAVCLLTGAWAFTWWGANVNNRVPTRIDGVWAPAAGTKWRQVFFERNRAHLAVFRRLDGGDSVHHFEVDADGTVRIWETWLVKGPLIMEGRVISDQQIELLAGSETVTLTRVKR